jgi:hypothetical protein
MVRQERHAEKKTSTGNETYFFATKGSWSAVLFSKIISAVCREHLSSYSMNGTDKTFKGFKSVTGCGRLAAPYSWRYPFTTVLLLGGGSHFICPSIYPTYLLVCHLSQNHSCLHFTVRHFHWDSNITLRSRSNLSFEHLQHHNSEMECLGSWIISRWSCLVIPQRRIGGVEVELYRFLNLAVDKDEWSNLQPGRFMPGNITRCALKRMLDGF